jgi:signal transduction histidine kinase
MSRPVPANDASSVPPRLFNGALNGRALIVEKDLRAAREIGRVLRAVVGPTDIRDSFAAIERHGEWDVAVINYDQLPPLERERIFTRFGKLNARGALLLFAGQTSRDEFVSLFGRHHATKLLARGGLAAEDLLVTVQKTLRQDIFGIEKYLGWGAVARELCIRSSSDKEMVLSACEELGDTIGLGDRKTSLLMTVAEELVTNALYDAPVDERQKARHAALPRSERVDLLPHEEVKITLASDGRRVGMSVEDPFGSLKAETVVEYLAKCFRRSSDQIDRKQGGAGLGLFYAFNSLSHFVVNIEPRKRTEFIGLIEVHGSYREFEAKPKSFNLFVQE